jgi:hypothetical protein
MQLFQTATGTVTLYDSVGGFKRIYERLKAFLGSEQESYRISSDFSDNPILNKQRLSAIEFVKSSGPVLASLDAHGLKVSGAPENLADYVDHFEFDSDASVGDHNHPEYFKKEGYIAPDTVSLVIEIGW